MVKENIEVLEKKYLLLIDEAHRRYDQAKEAYKTTKERMLLVFSAEIAIASLLFLGGIKMPEEPLLKILYYGSLAGIVWQLCVLLYNYRSKRNWPTPLSENEKTKILAAESYVGALEVVENDYRDSTAIANNLCYEIALVLNRALLILAACDIMILAIKFCS